jgi:hypothetical protein
MDNTALITTDIVLVANHNTPGPSAVEFLNAHDFMINNSMFGNVNFTQALEANFTDLDNQ